MVLLRCLQLGEIGGLFDVISGQIEFRDDDDVSVVVP